MDLAVLCDLASLPVEDIGRIIDISVFVGFWDGPVPESLKMCIFVYNVEIVII